MSEKVLVTGSSGHLGEALVRTLRNAGRPVAGVDIKPSAFTTHVGCVCDADFVRRCMCGVQTVFHTATLHKPHIGTHTALEFVQTNIAGTLSLLEAAGAAGVSEFVYTSTTSVFGKALNPSPELPAAWVTEDLTPVPKNIYGVTKLAAEDLCALAHDEHQMPCVVLRTSRFFPEEDDNRAIREDFSPQNAKLNELLHRRVDLQDVVDAHLLAADRAAGIGFAKYIVSATTPFRVEDTAALRMNARDVLRRRIPAHEQIYEQRGWRMFEGIDRVYVNERARMELGWAPKYDFALALKCLAEGTEPRSPLAIAVGAKGYHSTVFEDGPYPV